MSAKIKVLPDHLINQIAAGEVVEEAASAVKELVENALDAGARRIVVTIEKGGYQLLSVVDDGCGMSADDAVLCFERHATSKIRLAEDLFKLSTWGFRGEALAALAAVSKITLTTTLKQQQERGTKVEMAAGRILSVTPAGRSPGTSIEVRNLFYNVAARRKFQPSESASERAVLRLMTAFALGCPQVEFILQCEGEQTFYARGLPNQAQESVKKRLQEVLGEGLFALERPVLAEERGYSLEGFLSLPHLHRAQRSGQYLFVEGRYVFSPLVSRCVREAYSTRLPEGRHPLFVLFLRFPAGEVDVNVHPQKKEVRFRDEAFLSRFIHGALQASFLSSEYALKDAASGVFCLDESLAEDKNKAVLPWEMQEESPTHIPTSAPQSSDQWELHLGAARAFPNLEIIGLFDKYLIVTARSLPALCPLFIGKQQEGLVLIDLSLARMRVAFEDIYLKQHASSERQPLLIPRKIQLPKPEAVRLQKRLALFQSIGLEIQIIGEREFLIEGVPRFWEIDDVEEWLSPCLEEFATGSIEKELLHRLALRASSFVRWNKEKGNMSEAKALVDILLASHEPYFSPRGKPIMALLDERGLERLFYA